MEIAVLVAPPAVRRRRRRRVPVRARADPSQGGEADVRAPDRLGPEITPHQVELAREDPLASMRPKEVVRDARLLIDYLQAKEANPRLPFSRSSVVTGTWHWRQVHARQFSATGEGAVARAALWPLVR